MKAITYSRYGGPELLELSDVAAPVPRHDEVLVRVEAAALNPKDSLIRKGKFKALSGRTFPQLLGYDFAGVLMNATSTMPSGARVFGMKNGYRGSTLAQFATVKMNELVPMPDGLTFEEAAALPLVGLTALQALKPALDRARPAGVARVLIHGASGGVGVHAIQIAVALGAEVTTTSSPTNLELCRSLGASTTLDYARQTGLEQPHSFDVIFDVFGNRRFQQARPALRSGGTYVTTVPSLKIATQQVLTRFMSRRARLVVVHSNRADLERLSAMVSQKVLKPVIDRTFTLAETAAAQRLIETKRSRGKVVIQIPGEAQITGP